MTFGAYLLIAFVQLYNAPTQLVTQEFVTKLACDNFGRTLSQDAEANTWGTAAYRCVPLMSTPSVR